MKYAWLVKLVLRLTHMLWYRRINALLCQAYQRGVIDGRQLEALSAMFDPQGNHRVY
jgi:hypothetical protein